MGALLWDLTSGNYIRVLSDHTDWVMAVGISGDAKRALTSSFDGALRLWDLENGKSLHVFAGRAGGITTLAVTPDFRRAVSGSEGYWLEVWDLDNMSRIAAFAGDAEFRATVISPDGYRIVAGDQLGRLHFLQLQA
jgi:WD40 repeat protein